MLDITKFIRILGWGRIRLQRQNNAEALALFKPCSAHTHTLLGSTPVIGDAQMEDFGPILPLRCHPAPCWHTQTGTILVVDCSMSKICAGVYDQNKANSKNTQCLCPTKEKEVLSPQLHRPHFQVSRLGSSRRSGPGDKPLAGSRPPVTVYSVVESVFCAGHTVAHCSSQTSCWKTIICCNTQEPEGVYAHALSIIITYAQD